MVGTGDCSRLRLKIVWSVNLGTLPFLKSMGPCLVYGI